MKYDLSLTHSSFLYSHPETSYIRHTQKVEGMLADASLRTFGKCFRLLTCWMVSMIRLIEQAEIIDDEELDFNLAYFDRLKRQRWKPIRTIDFGPSLKTIELFILKFFEFCWISTFLIFVKHDFLILPTNTGWILSRKEAQNV